MRPDDPPSTGRAARTQCTAMSLDYRVTLVVEYLYWVDLDLGCSTILLGQ